MNIQECYEAIGGSYEEAKGRLQMDALIEKFARMFISDESYSQLVDAMEKKDVDAAFRAAHTMKGVCQNLSFTELGKVSSDVTEFLRSANMEDAGKLMPELVSSYKKTISALKELGE